MKFKKKSLLPLGLLTIMPLFLSSCGRNNNPNHPQGLIWHYLGHPMANFMKWTIPFVGNYGWSIIILTIIVRLVLLPLMVKQFKDSTIQQEKMNMLKPQINKIQEQLKNAKTPEEQTMISQTMMKLYKDNGISMTGGMGCLPLIIQIPIFTALYSAIYYTPKLSTTFLGINLSKPNIVLAILAFLSYLLQGYLSMIGLPEEQKKVMKPMLLMSPLMTLFITFSSPAGLGLYFLIGGLFACLQTLFIVWYRPKVRQSISNNINVSSMKELNQKINDKQKISHTNNIVEQHEVNRKRNLNKQNKKR